MEENRIRILIVEDEFITLETLSTVLREMEYEIAGEVMNARDAIAVLEKGEVDLAILDINIKGDYDGVWLAQRVHEDYAIPFIFLTAFGDKSTVQRALETEPYGYLVKPFNKVDIFTAIEVALKNFAKQKPAAKEEVDSVPIITRDTLYVRDKYMFVKLKITEIVYIKSDKNYLEIHLLKKKHLVRGKMSEFLVNLPTETFVQVNRSYVVNLEFIEQIGGGFIVVNGVEVPLGKSYREELKKRISFFN